jgi:hypothetical protein
MTMVLPPPDKEVIKGVREAFGLDQTGMEQAVQLMKDWLKQQPHLPQEIGKWTDLDTFPLLPYLCLQ